MAKNLILASALGLASAYTVQAQEAAQTTPVAKDAAAPADDDIVRLSRFVVTGSVIDKTELESANSIAVLSKTQIDRISPRSTADMLTQIPGLYVEPTAGSISNNYYIRGLPSGGGTRFLGMVEDGLPIVIGNSDFTFRGDALCIDSVEVLRGGSSSILTSYAPGGTINFRNREGTNVTSSTARLTLSDYGQVRTDLVVSGPLGKSFTYMLSGYYNADDSQRDTGWGKVNQGGQFSGNVKYTFPDNRGYFKVSARYLDDQSAYYATELYQDQNNPQSVKNGPDISKGTYYGQDTARMTIWTGDGPRVNDFSKGVPVQMSFLGSELKYDFGNGWTLVDRNRATRYYHKFNGLFGGNTVDGTGNALATYGIPILIANASGRPGFANLATFSTYRVTEAVSGRLVAPATMNGNGAIQLIYPMEEFGLERNYQNDLQLQKEIGANIITVGFYYNHYTRDFTQFGNQALTDVRNHANLLNVEAFDTLGNSLGMITDNGFTQYGAWYTRNKYTQTNTAPYITDEIKLGKWRFDAGYRYEKAKQYFENGPQTSYSGFITRDVNQHNPALYGGNTVAPGTWKKTDSEGKGHNWTVGANYLLSTTSAVYGRYSVGTFLSQDPQSTTPSPQPKITQMELGYRGSLNQSFLWNATLFNSEASNNEVNIGVPVNGTLIFSNVQLKTRNYGIELMGTWKATTDLAFDVQGTLSKSGYMGEGVISTANGNVPIDGKRPVRQPDKIFSVTARYKLPVFSKYSPEVYLNDAYTSARASDIANAVWLPAYNVINAGFILKPSANTTIKLHMANVFNEVALTEGNPRQTQASGNANAVYYGARAIFGRSIQGSIEYKF